MIGPSRLLEDIIYFHSGMFTHPLVPVSGGGSLRSTELNMRSTALTAEI